MVGILKHCVFAVDQDLLGLSVSSIDEAYEVYNDYAFKLGFSVRRGCCAFVQFDLDRNGMCIVSNHEKLHNHELVPPTKSYLLRSHRSVSINHLSYLKDLKKSGVSVADGLRFLKTRSEGSPLVGFTNRDAYNSLCTDVLNKLDGIDSNTLIEIFRRRQSSEKDFFFDFEVDDESRSFLRSINGKSPQSIMTDQCAAMAAAISQVFSRSRDRLCIWHIGENSKKHINGLRSQKDFLDIFNCLLKHIDTKAEFELYWTREKWCPAFNKDYFSGGILSSQRSETTNHSISRRLSKTAGLCDFYSSFVGVVSEWRNRENGEDVRCSQGVPTMVMDHIKILSHARDIYTIEIYYLFEDCKLFTETEILCCHCLRILNVHCVSEVPKKYILNRWTKKVLEVENRSLRNFRSWLFIAKKTVMDGKFSQVEYVISNIAGNLYLVHPRLICE
ncbi:protein FAR1-RELATED SEQUENCE 6-like [Ipomoea triloba]|uniref:protein FAR1-RELATED SEQUENCE 6-like n=1 Tax=Ipomoea triloba TaxID=35885 RepID=UPI00125D5EBF|nr:protein FAR1-RELATED SEQUENCE 6-like [Ipomoea triloba]